MPLGVRFLKTHSDFLMKIKLIIGFLSNQIVNQEQKMLLETREICDVENTSGVGQILGKGRGEGLLRVNTPTQNLEVNF